MEKTPSSISATQLSKVKKEPYSLNPIFEWTKLDMNSDEMLEKLIRFVNNNYPANNNYSKEFTKWILSPYSYDQSWIIGISVKKSKALAGFIVLCRQESRDYRSKGLASLLIKELTRRIQLKNVWHAVYLSFKTLPRFTPVTICRYWIRMLNVKKAIHLGREELGKRMKMHTTVRLYGLPAATITSGFKKMEKHDVLAIHMLLSDYLENFEVAMNGFAWLDVDHWFLPEEGQGFIYSYIVQPPGSHKITDFCSFSRASYTVAGNPKHTTLEYACSSFNVATKTSFPDLMKDVLISAKNKGFDMFTASDVMHNEKFLEDLKFKKAGGEMHCYLHNYQLERKLKPSHVALFV